MITCHDGLNKKAEHAEHGQAAVLELLDLRTTTISEVQDAAATAGHCLRKVSELMESTGLIHKRKRSIFGASSPAWPKPAHLELCQGVRVRCKLQGVKWASRVQSVKTFYAWCRPLGAV